MWYVIKTDFGKELNAKEELIKVPQIWFFRFSRW